MLFQERKIQAPKAWLAGILSVVAVSGPSMAKDEVLPGLGGQVPWRNGEKLEYGITWGLLSAARAVYAAKRLPNGQWLFTYEMKTRGTTHLLYPVESKASSLHQANPWRSRRFEETRSQNGSKSDLRLTMQYGEQRLLFEDFAERKTETVEFDGPALENLLSLFYSLRTVDWKEREKRAAYVADRDKIRRVEASYKGRVTLETEAGPKNCRLVWVQPFYDDPEKDRAGYGAAVWLGEDPARIPLQADMKMKFGTVRVSLLRSSSEPTTP